MKLLKYVLVAATVAAATAAHADPLLTENFENNGNLLADLQAKGWLTFNASIPVGTTTWTQGDESIFAAQAGSATSYVTADYNSAAVDGYINNYLLTPMFSTEKSGTVTFWAKAAIADGFSDYLSFGVLSSVSGISLLSPVLVSGDWVEYSYNYAAGGVGSFARFIFDYTGPSNSANYIGIDTLTVTPVPEPSTWAMFALGLGALGYYGRRRTVKQQA